MEGLSSSTLRFVVGMNGSKERCHGKIPNVCVPLYVCEIEKLKMKN